MPEAQTWSLASATVLSGGRRGPWDIANTTHHVKRPHDSWESGLERWGWEDALRVARRLGSGEHHGVGGPQPQLEGGHLQSR